MSKESNQILNEMLAELNKQKDRLEYCIYTLEIFGATEDALVDINNAIENIKIELNDN